ncbi:MAG: hypothetical protein K0Q73_5572 [Paenibacillus sp.]|jgi:hypothetical protein|nr:hypothetical protein [Paenibacillus sp.]
MSKYTKNVQIGHVTTEGDTMYFEVRGQGDPLLMIAPGGGDGDHLTLTIHSYSPSSFPDFQKGHIVLLKRSAGRVRN